MAEDWDRSDGGTYVRDADARARIKDRAHEREMRQGKKRIGNAPLSSTPKRSSSA